MKKMNTLWATVNIIFISIAGVVILSAACAAASELGAVSTHSGTGAHITLAIAAVPGTVVQQLASHPKNKNHSIDRTAAGTHRNGHVSFNTDTIEEGHGSEFKALAKSVYQLLVMDDTDDSGDSEGEGSFAVAMTSQYINDRLPAEGMRLEFHADPMDGGGAIFFKKSF